MNVYVVIHDFLFNSHITCLFPTLLSFWNEKQEMAVMWSLHWRWHSEELFLIELWIKILHTSSIIIAFVSNPYRKSVLHFLFRIISRAEVSDEVVDDSIFSLFLRIEVIFEVDTFNAALIWYWRSPLYNLLSIFFGCCLIGIKHLFGISKQTGVAGG